MLHKRFLPGLFKLISHRGFDPGLTKGYSYDGESKIQLRPGHIDLIKGECDTLVSDEDIDLVLECENKTGNLSVYVFNSNTDGADTLNSSKFSRYVSYTEELVRENKYQNIIVTPLPIRESIDGKSSDATVFLYRELYYCPLEHVMAPSSIISLTNEEKDALMKKLNVTRDKFPSMYSTDPIAKWKGIPVDTLVHLKIPNMFLDDSKYNIEYRMVVNPPSKKK